MSEPPSEQAWRCRVAELLDDPVTQAVLRRDRLTKAHVLDQLAPVADYLRGEQGRRAFSIGPA